MGRSRNRGSVAVGEGSRYETARDENVAESMERDEKWENKDHVTEHEVEEVTPATEGENSAD